MSNKDMRVNEHGVSVDDLVPGRWITVRWNDVGDVQCLLLDIERRQATFKGDRDLKVFEPSENFAEAGHFETRAVHSQVVSVDGYLNQTPLT
jgi:hypothetical protein